MEHKTILTKLIFYLEGTLPEGEMKSISKHLDNCNDCRLFFEELKMNWQLIEEDKQIDVSPYFYAKVKTKLQHEKRPKIRIYAKYLQPAFFILILAAGIDLGVWMGTTYTQANNAAKQEASLLPLDDMSQEPIEQFLINFE